MSYTLPSLLDLQDEVAAQFANHPQFGKAAKPIEVVSLRRKKATSIIQAALANVRVVGLVLPFDATSSKPTFQTGEPPFYDDINCVVQFIEIPELNKTGYDAAQYCAMAANHLTGYKPQGMNTFFSMNAEGCHFVARGEMPDSSVVAVVYQFKIQTQGVLGDVVLQCAEPTYSVSGSTFPLALTLACATSGAKIYYTLDGSTYPDTVNGTLYSSAITLPSPCTVIARAWKDGYRTSDELRLSATA